jgi:hypothetical protein
MAKPYGRIYNNNKNVSITPLDIKDLYPVGSIYLSINKTNPSTYFGGTWEQLYGGYLYAAQSSIGKTDYVGWGTQGHTLTVSQMPSHTHTQNSHKHHGLRHNDSGSSGDTIVVSTTYGSTGCIELGWSRSSTGAPYDNVSTRAATATNQNTGGGGAHSHNIATVDVFVWKRTA